MKVTKVEAKDWFGNELKSIAVFPCGNRYYKASYYFKLSVYTDDGKVYIYEFYPNFELNYRSGCLIVDVFIDQIGSSLEEQAAYWAHDAAYTPCASLGGKHPIGRKEADELLRAMLRFAGMSSFKASCVYNSVRLFGGSAYKEDDHLTKANSELFNFAKMEE